MIAKYYGVPPWQLEDVPPDWLAVADTVMAAEAGARRELELRAERRARAAAGARSGRGRSLGRR